MSKDDLIFVLCEKNILVQGENHTCSLSHENLNDR
jgi:hypothetical protein